MNKQLWVCGKLLPGVDAWEMQGVFDEEAKAVAACFSPQCFVGPIELNVELPHEQVDWPDAYVPTRDA